MSYNKILKIKNYFYIFNLCLTDIISLVVEQIDTLLTLGPFESWNFSSFLSQKILKYF